MSGSSGSSFTGNVGAQDVSCDSLVIETQLSSPKEDVIELIPEAALLNLIVSQKDGTSVVEVIYEGRVAGGIASPQVQQLRQCIESGTHYIAAVTSKRDGQIRVRITAVRPH